MSVRKGKLRIENSLNCSGIILNEHHIPILKEKNYIIKNYDLDGDAPKQFIKVYQYSRDSNIRRVHSNSWAPYIAKTAEKWYPIESVIEYMINRIGQGLRIKMNEIKLVKANGQIRFLSKYFLNKSEKLIHAAEICGEHLGDMDMAKQIADDKLNSRDLFTFEYIVKSIQSVFPGNSENLLCELIKMITFDAIAGNNDRHFYN